jgi:class I fructose-bisphosphate aldolase
MNLAKLVRLNRVFAHPSGQLCSVAIDHFIGYQQRLPCGLTNLPETLAKLAPGVTRMRKRFISRRRGRYIVFG